MLAATSLVKKPKKELNMLLAEKSGRLAQAEESRQISPAKKKWELNLAAYLLMWWWGKESKNMHFARRNWKVNSKKPQNYPVQKCIELAQQAFGSSGGGLGGRGATGVEARSFPRVQWSQCQPAP